MVGDPKTLSDLPARVKPLDAVLIHLALTILGEAAPRSTKAPVATPEVRLALYVLRPYLRDDALVRGAWESARSEQRACITSLHQQLAWIEVRLRQRGWIAPEPVLRFTKAGEPDHSG